MLLAAGLVAMAMTAGQNGVSMTAACQGAIADAAAAFPEEKLVDGDIAITIAKIDPKTKSLEEGSVHGGQAFYPASVVKFFYLMYAAHRLDQGKIRLTEEAERAVRDMIVDSNNDATGYVVDWLCGTTPGPELPPDQLKKFIEKRNVVNRWYQSLGFTGVNACNRTFNEGPYGRETQLLGPKLEHRNSLTPDACVKLMSGLMLDKLVSKKEGDWARSFLKRDVPADNPKTNAQARGFIGSVLPKGSTLYSKAGWVDTVRHDVAGVVFPDGQEFAVAIFTKRGKNTKLVSWLAGDLFKRLGMPVVPPAPYEGDIE